jgi:HlyD family secretion protein
MTRRLTSYLLIVAAGVAAPACRRDTPEGPPRATGYVEATDTRVASRVGGRIERVDAQEGARVAAGATLAQISTAEIDLAIRRAQAERDQAQAQLRLVQAGARPEDIRQAEAQVAAARAEQQAAVSERDAARQDEVRFERLVANKAGATKQRDDAVARRQTAEARVAAAGDRVNAAEAALARLRAGSREEEIAAARARVGAVEAQIATLQHDRGETTIVAPSGGIIGSRLVEPGELVAPGAPIVVIVDLDHAWANVYVEERAIADVKLDQPAVVVTDSGKRLDGRVTFISPRAEFTPRNVQTADERAKLVYRVKVSVDNREGILKPGMPVEVELKGAAGLQTGRPLSAGLKTSRSMSAGLKTSRSFAGRG